MPDSGMFNDADIFLARRGESLFVSNCVNPDSLKRTRRRLYDSLEARVGIWICFVTIKFLKI